MRDDRSRNCCASMRDQLSDLLRVESEVRGSERIGAQAAVRRPGVGDDRTAPSRQAMGEPREGLTARADIDGQTEDLHHEDPRYFHGTISDDWASQTGRPGLATNSTSGCLYIVTDQKARTGGGVLKWMT